MAIGFETDDDAFTFKINVYQTPLVERVMLSVINEIYDSLGFTTSLCIRRKNESTEPF